MPIFTFALLALLALAPTLPGSTPATATAPSTAPATLPAGRVELRIGEMVIEHSPEDEPFAREFAKWLAEVRPGYLKRLDESTRAYTTLLATSRDADLKFIAEQLALDKPTDEMGRLYDSFGASVIETIHSGMRMERVTIWRRSELHRRLKGGEAVPTFKLDPDGKVAYAWNANFKFNLYDNPPTTRRAVMETFIMPIIITDDDLRRDDRDIQRHKHETFKMLAGLANPKSLYGRVGEMLAVTSLHETTEAALVRHYLKSKDRRWFLDGVANHVAFTRLRYKMGSQSADAFYQSVYNPEKYAKWLDKVDLDRWPTAEDENASSPKGDFLHAHYYLATETIHAAVDYHGPDLLPRLLKELKPVPVEKATMADVHAAFTRVTGDDLRKLVERTRARLLRASAGQPTTAATAPATTTAIGSERQ